MMRHWLLVGALALTLGLTATTRPGLAAPDPTAFVGDLGTEGIQVLGPDVPQTQRLARFRALFRQDFDIPDIGRFVLGRYWREMTPEQQQEFLGLFQEYTVRAYSERLGQFGGAQFRVTGTTPTGDEIVVTSEVDRTNGPPVKIDWHLRDRDGQYKITDVYVDGVSMKVAQRDTFASLVQKNGGRADAVLAVLRQELAVAR